MRLPGFPTASVLFALLLTAGMSCGRSPLSPSLRSARASGYGVVTQTWSPDHSRWVGDLGVGWVRLDFNWFEIEPARTVFRWSDVDERVHAATGAGVRIFATLAYTPSWAGPCLHCMPNDLDDWEHFVAAVLEHFRGAGIVYGIWNEPNLDFLDDTDDAMRYSQLFSRAHSARLHVDRATPLAGPEVSHHAVPQYFEAVMDQISHDMEPSDIVTVHYYPDAPVDLVSYLAMVRQHAGGHVIWLTETGFDSCDDAAQSAYYESVLNSFVSLGRTWWGKLFFYVLHNGEPCGEAMVTADGRYRQAFALYRRFIVANP